MKPQALQELVSKIFSDRETRANFLSNPDSVLVQFKLTEDEKKAVLNTSAKFRHMTADSTQLETAIEPMLWWNAPTPL